MELLSFFHKLCLNKWIKTLKKDNQIHHFSMCHQEEDMSEISICDKLKTHLTAIYKDKSPTTPHDQNNHQCIFYQQVVHLWQVSHIHSWRCMLWLDKELHITMYQTNISKFVLYQFYMRGTEAQSIMRGLLIIKKKIQWFILCSKQKSTLWLWLSSDANDNIYDMNQEHAASNRNDEDNYENWVQPVNFQQK